MKEATDGGAKRCALITGVTGFIGSNLARALPAAGYTVRALVRDPARAPGIDGVEPVPGDLANPASLDGIADGVDIVVHCAGILGKWGTPDEELRAVNVGGSLALLDQFAGRSLRRFVHLSAGGVTGPVPGRTADETYACQPATVYERTKFEAEQELLRRAAASEIPALVVRPTFTYGPGDPHKIGLFKAIKKGRYAFIDDGESVNHPVYIDDLVAGILLAIDNGRLGEVYIIGGERPVSKKELVYTIADALGVKRPWIRLPRWVAWPAASVLELIGRRLGFEPILTRSRVMMMADNFGYSIDKAVRELAYQPQTDLRTGIARTVEDYRASGKL